MSASVRYSILYGAVFFTPGVFMPFFPLFLTGQGFDAAAVGLLLALSGPARVIGNPLMLWLVDLGVSARSVLVAAHIMAALLLALQTTLTSFWPMALAIAAFSFLHAPTIAVTDSTVTRATKRDRALIYGRIRLWGSITFVAASLAGGAVVARLPPVGIAWLMVAGLIASGLLSLVTPRDGAAPTASTPEEAHPPAGPVSALVAVILASATIQASHAALYGFGAIHWQARGFSGDVIGVLWVIGVMAEIVLFARFATLSTTIDGALARLGISACVAMARWLAMSFDPPLWATAIAQIGHAFTYGMTHLAVMAALILLAPQRWRARAQGAHAGVISLMMSSMTYVAGVAYETYGVKTYLMMSGVGAVGALFVVIAWLRVKRYPQSAASGG